MPEPKTALGRVAGWINQRARWLSVGVGLVIVAIWTVIRCLTNGVNFDVVGQIGLVDQWTHGLRAGAEVGPTNYLLKMPIYLVVNGLHFLPPHGRILLLALLFNLVTFYILFWLFEKALNLYRVGERSWFYLGMVWLASISGSVFWLDYANSRNLETAGAIGVLYLVLRGIQKWSAQTAISLGVLAAVICFADTLQVFVTALPIILYLVGRWLWLRTKRSFDDAWRLGGVLLLALGASKLLFKLAQTVLPVRFLQAPTPLPKLSLHTVGQIIQQELISIGKIFDADFWKRPYTPNSVRELLNAIILIAITAVIIRLVFDHRPLKFPKWLLILLVIMNYLVYAASGQALQFETERYLIMAPLMTVLLVALLGDWLAASKVKRRLQIAWSGVLIVSSCLLIGALIVSWPTRYSKDTYITATLRFVHQNHFAYAVSSREIALTSNYFAERSAVILPTICANDYRLHVSDLFYDKAPFNKMVASNVEVPVIIQVPNPYGGNHCDKPQIIKQFGQPEREMSVPGIGIAEVYRSTALRLEH